MKNFIQINSECATGDQPSFEEISDLAQKGYKTVINLRGEGENDQPISPTEEGRLVKALGLEYIHFPILLKNLTKEQIQSFNEHIKKLPSPVFVHCHRGIRAGVLVVLDHAFENNLSGEEAIQYAKSKGFEYEGTDVGNLIKDILRKE